MKKSIDSLFIIAIFFTFTIGQYQNAYDRVTPQVLYLSIINFASLFYIFYSISHDKIIDYIKKNKLFLSYTAYILITGISIIVAENKPEAIITFAKYLTYFLTFCVFLFFGKFSKINLIDLFLKLIVVSIFIESSAVILSVYDSVVVNGLEFVRDGQNYRGFSANINIVAFSLVMKSPVISYYLFKSNNKFVLTLCYLLFFMISSALFFLLTRGAFLAFILVIAFMFLYMLIRKTKTSFKKIIISLFVFLLSYTATNQLMSSNKSNVVLDRISSINLNNNDESINQRLRYYSAALKSIRMNPILGVGVGNWKFISIKYDSKKMSEYTVPYYVHNDFLQIAAEIGLLGILFFLYFIFNPFLLLMKKIYSSKENLVDLMIFLMISVYIIDSLLNFPINRPISHILFLLLIVVFQTNEKKSYK